MQMDIIKGYLSGKIPLEETKVEIYKRMSLSKKMIQELMNRASIEPSKPILEE